MEKELTKTEKNKITLETNGNRFNVYELENEDFVKLKEFNTFEEADEYLTKRVERKSKGLLIRKKPITAIIKQSGWKEEGFIRTNITSIEINYNSVYCWNTNEDKRRSKESVTYFLKDTENNWKTIKEIERLKEQIDNLEKTKERFTEDELKDYFQDK